MQRRSRQRRRPRTNNRSRKEQDFQRESRPVRSVGSPVTQAAPPRIPVPVRYAEPKYLDTGGVSVPVSTSLDCYSLTDTINGTSDINRIGDQIKLHSLELRFTGNLADTTNIVRLIVFQWYGDDTNDSPTASQLLVSGGSQPYNSPFQHDGYSKFHILYDKIMTLSTYYPVKHDSVLIQLDARPIRQVVRYYAGATTGNNKIFLGVCSDSGTSSHPFIDYYARLNFYDT